MREESKYALLIDADNISPKYIDIILREAKSFGNISIRRVYGDWTETDKSSWKKCLLENSLNPIQQYSYTIGKNASDSAMIIDAMDILYTGCVDGFILASSDSDFTKLAMRLREAGKHVVGMGERKTPSPFVKACDQFKTLDILFKSVVEEKEAKKAAGKAAKKDAAARQEDGKQEKASTSAKAEETEDISPITDIREIKSTIIVLLDEHSDEDGWMFLGDIGNMLTKLYPDFDCRNYGYNKLSLLMSSFPELELRKKRQKDGYNQLVYVKKK